MPFAPNSFDVILQLLAPFAAKRAERQKEVQRVLDLLRPGGHSIFTGWEDEYGATCNEWVERGFCRAEHHRFAYSYTSKKMSTLED